MLFEISWQCIFCRRRRTAKVEAESSRSVKVDLGCPNHKGFDYHYCSGVLQLVYVARPRQHPGVPGEMVAGGGKE